MKKMSVNKNGSVHLTPDSMKSVKQLNMGTGGVDDPEVIAVSKF